MLWGTRDEVDRIAFTLRGGSEDDRAGTFAELQRRVGEQRVRRGDIGPARALFDALRGTGTTLATAESCTGGLLSSWITDLPGASGVFVGGVVAYANEVKFDLLGVEPRVVERDGAVSREVVEAMARGVIAATGSDYGIGLSGVAGPDRGDSEKPVGTTWIAATRSGGQPVSEEYLFSGGRGSVRRRAAAAACLMAEALVLQSPV